MIHQSIVYCIGQTSLVYPRRLFPQYLPLASEEHMRAAQQSSGQRASSNA